MRVRHYLKLATIGLFFVFLVIYRENFITRAHVKTESKIPKSILGIQQLSAEAEALLRKYLDAAEMPELHLTNFASYQKETKEFYAAVGDTLPWIDQGRPTPEARAIIHCLQDAAYKGLQPEDYDGPEWEVRLAKFERSPGLSESELVKFDLALTVSTMRYILDLHLGRANPHIFHTQLDIEYSQLDLSEFLRQKLIVAADVSAVLESVEPPFPIYRRTENALKKYLEFARTDGGAPLPVPARTIKPGDSYERITQLAKLLAIQGDLSAVDSEVSVDQKYEGPIVEGVEHFQNRHGLEPKGILDAATLKKMNTPFSERITQLQLTMERLRWLPHRFQKPPIIVNIPEFRLYAVNDQYRSAFTMKVVVGRAYGHQTPVFASQIKSVIFRPYWNVPHSIVKAELVPHLKKDSSYFSKNDYEIVDKNAEVVTEAADSKDVIAQLNSGKLGVRQKPGPQNALGLIKFEFPNQYDVYMHGTPSKALFARTRRDFSHGCIRVEDPVELAKWVLQDRPEWSEENMRAAIDGEDRVEVKLKEPIPVLIFYSTAVVLEGGEVHFYDDIYGLDAQLEETLAQRELRSAAGESPN